MASLGADRVQQKVYEAPRFLRSVPVRRTSRISENPYGLVSGAQLQALDRALEHAELMT
jgi:hypothetical protein